MIDDDCDEEELQDRNEERIAQNVAATLRKFFKTSAKKTPDSKPPKKSSQKDRLVVLSIIKSGIIGTPAILKRLQADHNIHIDSIEVNEIKRKLQKMGHDLQKLAAMGKAN